MNIINDQPIVKQNLELDGVNKPYEVNSIFWTIQGEGPYQGRPAIFVRFAGCNLKCYWCDTKYNTNMEMKVEDIVDYIEGLLPAELPGTPLVVFTGGEPLRQNLMPLVKRLAPTYQMQVETNGTLMIPDWDWGMVTMVCSPKTSQVHPKVAEACVHWKYVCNVENIDESEDGLPMLSTQVPGKHNKLYRPEPTHTQNIWVSPMDEKDTVLQQVNTEMVIKVSQRFNYRLNLQQHKIIGVE